MTALRQAVELGVNFFDTADKYGDGKSETLLSRLKEESTASIYIATKAGQKIPAGEEWEPEKLVSFIEGSLKRLKTDTLDLFQLHSPPTDVYYKPEIFRALDKLVQQGKIKNYGASVRRVEEGLKALEYPNLKTVQLIFNIFRQRPAELFFREAVRRKVGVIVRVPLASGMLTGKMRPETSFENTDHRSFNIHGEKFDRGETFSGVEYQTGLNVADELKDIVPREMTLAQFALRWILMFDAVSTVIPGAKNSEQAKMNASASEFPPLSDEQMSRVNEIYERRIREQVHQRW